MEPKIFVVTPTYNERENILKLITAIQKLNIPNLHILVVDDNSPDGTGEVVKEFCSLDESVHLLAREKKSGLGNAYKDGFRWALSNGAEIIIEMDADFSHDPFDIPRLIAEINQGFDLVIGSRLVGDGGVVGWGAKRTFMSRSAMILSRILLGLKTKDVTAGFRAFRREVFSSVDLSLFLSTGYSFQEEMVFWCEKKHLKIKEIPVKFVDRQFGQSKLSLAEAFNFLTMIFKIKVRNIFR